MLSLGQVDPPVPGPGQILVRVRATSVNRPDIIQREGNYPPPKGDSEILGLEMAGVVEAVGDGVDNFTPGDRVMALVGGGGYAEQAVAWAGHAMRIPAAMSFEEAACVCETYITAWLNLFRIGGLGNGQVALLHGGGGGVNTAAVQLCRNLVPDTRLVVTASPRKIDRVRELGVHLVIDYTSTDFADETRHFTVGAGADVILDHIGARYLAGNLRALAVGGRLLVIGVLGGVKAEINLATLMVKRQQLIGSVLRSRPVEEKASIIAAFEAAVMPLFESGAVVPLIDVVMPLDKVADAHRLMEQGGHFGKIVLVP
jgi:putative PIG3 family NAD(P)H quinone oxidoreductase